MKDPKIIRNVRREIRINAIEDEKIQYLMDRLGMNLIETIMYCVDVVYDILKKTDRK